MINNLSHCSSSSFGKFSRSRSFPVIALYIFNTFSVSFSKCDVASKLVEINNPSFVLV